MGYRLRNEDNAQALGIEEVPFRDGVRRFQDLRRNLARANQEAARGHEACREVERSSAVNPVARPCLSKRHQL
jgi:hypothetical protein